MIPALLLSLALSLPGGEPSIRVLIADPGPVPHHLRGRTGETKTIGRPGGYVRVNGTVYPGTVEVRETVAGPRVVNRVPVEEYVAGVVGSEVPGSWPMAALKAQAVIARTYVLKRREDARAAGAPYDVVSSVKDQAYRGRPRNTRISRAVDETRGQVLLHGDGLITAFYHSTCGGRSATVVEVFPGSSGASYLTHDTCFCQESPKYRWEVTIPAEDLRGALVLTRIQAVSIVKRTESGRVGLVLVTDGTRGYLFTGAEFRRLTGYREVPSTWFEIGGMDSSGLHLRGRGYGHGVGLCQWGARGMAASGRDYREILGFYYPQTRLEPYAGR